MRPWIFSILIEKYLDIRTLMHMAWERERESACILFIKMIQTQILVTWHVMSTESEWLDVFSFQNYPERTSPGGKVETTQQAQCKKRERHQHNTLLSVASLSPGGEIYFLLQHSSYAAACPISFCSSSKGKFSYFVQSSHEKNSKSSVGHWISTQFSFSSRPRRV